MKILMTVGLLVLLTASTVDAQSREGFWIGFGLGVGSLDVESGTTVQNTGAVGYLKLGGTINENLLLGVELNGWFKKDGLFTLTHANVSAVAYFYPDAASGLYLKSGVGFSRFEARLGGITAPATRNSAGVVLGVGYDVRLGEKLSITPLFNFNTGISDVGAGNTTVIEFGVGLSWH